MATDFVQRGAREKNKGQVVKPPQFASMIHGLLSDDFSGEWIFEYFTVAGILFSGPQVGTALRWLFFSLENAAS